MDEIAGSVKEKIWPVEKLGRYVTEIVIIFIGITVSFLFDQWREQQKNMKKEIEFVNSLITDLKTKADEINGSDFIGATLLGQNADSLINSFYHHRPVSDKLAVIG